MSKAEFWIFLSNLLFLLSVAQTKTPGVTSLSFPLSYYVSSIQEIPICSTFKEDPDFNHFSPPSLVLPWSKWLSSLAWIM
jgi:hypothetical protein